MKGVMQQQPRCWMVPGLGKRFLFRIAGYGLGIQRKVP